MNGNRQVDDLLILRWNCQLQESRYGKLWDVQVLWLPELGFMLHGATVMAISRTDKNEEEFEDVSVKYLMKTGYDLWSWWTTFYVGYFETYFWEPYMQFQWIIFATRGWYIYFMIHWYWKVFCYFIYSIQQKDMLFYFFFWMMSVLSMKVFLIYLIKV